MAKLAARALQMVVDRDTIVKDETLTIPLTLLGRNFLQIFENAALQVIHLIKPFGSHERR